MSLREEIMYKIADYHLGKIKVAEDAAADILKMVNKAIDSMLLSKSFIEPKREIDFVMLETYFRAIEDVKEVLK